MSKMGKMAKEDSIIIYVVSSYDVVKTLKVLYQNLPNIKLHSKPIAIAINNKNKECKVSFLNGEKSNVQHK